MEDRRAKVEAEGMAGLREGRGGRILHRRDRNVAGICWGEREPEGSLFGSSLRELSFQIPASYFANPSFAKATEDGRASKDRKAGTAIHALAVCWFWVWRRFVSPLRGSTSLGGVG